MAEDTQELRRDIEQTRQNLGRDVDALTDKVSPSQIVQRRVGRVREGVDQLRHRVMGKVESIGDSASSAKSSAGSGVQSVGSSVQDAGGAVVHAVGSAPQQARQKTRGAPLAAGVVAFALGYVLSAALPPSDKERELAQQAKDKAVDPLKEQASGIAQDLKENLQEPAQEAVQHVKETATEAAAEVKDQGQSAAQDVQGEARDSAETVRQNR